jgi:hypothetical protein
MKRIIKLSLLIGAFAAAVLFFGMSEKKAVALSGGSDPSFTGAPGEGTCTGCHSGGSPVGTLLPAVFATEATIGIKRR